MASDYSVALCRELLDQVRAADLAWRPRRRRYEPGDVLELDFLTVWPEVEGHGRFRIDKFVGGGFAGQVYLCRLEHVELQAEAGDAPLSPGGLYAVKILVPPSAFSRRFRDLVYWLGFQAPFSGQVNRGACRAGLLWQKLARLASAVEFGDEDSVADVYASFRDDEIGAYGEIREWVEGRTWRLEPDVRMRLRRRWRTIPPGETGSPEYVAKRRFMHRFVRLLHRMGAPELARQYEWWTMKSQPNVLKRAEGHADPAAGLCAVDFRAGLALLPVLPMSPADVVLILRGLCRGSLVQFDRCDIAKLKVYTAAFPEQFRDAAMIDRLAEYDREYRAGMPDLCHQGLRLLWDAGLRRTVRRGLADGYVASRLAGAGFAEGLAERPGRFAVYYLLGAFPVAGRLIRRLWGHPDYRHHVRRFWKESGYRHRAWLAARRAVLVRWHRAGRCTEARARHLCSHPGLYWAQRLTLGLLPFARLHRALAEPSYAIARLRAGWRFVRDFYREAQFRERWLAGLVREGHADGMLADEERDEILARVGDPFIAKYLKCLAVHFATLPVTQIVSVIVGGVAAVWVWFSGHGGDAALGCFVAIIVVFQLIPVSPGSICRGGYVVYLMIRERNFRDYVVAGPLSFVKYIGYLAFPMQMVTTYPALARFMASRWATGAVRLVPVFGEKGGLLEHFVFDLFFNLPRVFARWARPRLAWFLEVWMLAGLVLGILCFGGCGVRAWEAGGINLPLAIVGVFVLPRVLFYPVLTRAKGQARPGRR